MTEFSRTLLIGVDAGGSKTTAWVVDEADALELIHPQPLGRGSSGPANPTANGFDTACRAIEQAIQNALVDAGIRLDHATQPCQIKLCLSVAGVGREREKQQMTDWAQTRFNPASLAVTDDAQPILAAASPQQVGIALICGTGSYAWGRGVDGLTDRCGGWGYLFGDEGSGYAIGVAGLTAAAKFADGRGERTVLLDALCQWLKIEKSSQLIESIYGGSTDRGAVARLSEVVFAAASEDAVASGIVDQAVEGLSAMVHSLAPRLNFGSEDSGLSPILALGGGVLVHQPLLRQRLAEKLPDLAEKMAVVSTPVAGAIRIAGAE
ncbi:hypothetical protein NHH03_10310 [Stieleria sp. TO1_6]|uniref:N-acetylglucosamine kinase n=1 Tax=Stieleria tagensis TaxID=2956795 RepID=UPI00209B1AEB|nr:BadF/BadG/BcrA/BcrD ATPase family protein [Stieleria tagensis]MCO8122131.1 hypothetical protein [Stieleria tagensis]